VEIDRELPRIISGENRLNKYVVLLVVVVAAAVVMAAAAVVIVFYPQKRKRLGPIRFNDAYCL